MDDKEDTEKTSIGTASFKESSKRKESYNSNSIKNDNNDQNLNENLISNYWNTKNNGDSKPNKFSFLQKIMIWTGLGKKFTSQKNFLHNQDKQDYIENNNNIYNFDVECGI